MNCLTCYYPHVVEHSSQVPINLTFVRLHYYNLNIKTSIPIMEHPTPAILTTDIEQGTF